MDVTGGPCLVCTNTRTGGDGWFGTVGAGYDWQGGSSWVVGIFGDGTFGSLKGNIGDASIPAVGTTKMETAWAAGARVGYLVAPNVLSYVNGGYTGTYWTGSTLLDSFTGTPSGFHTDSFNTQRLVRRRRRREQPELLRNQRSRLVHEDGISCGLA